jgi:ribosome-associated protein
MRLDHRTVELVRVAARAADKVKGEAITAFNVSVRCPLTDVFVIVSAGNPRQANALVDEIQRQLASAGAYCRRREGEASSSWVLLDYGEFVVHVQQAEEREFYGLDRLWKDCPLLDLELPGVPRPLAGIGAGTALDAAS